MIIKDLIIKYQKSSEALDKIGKEITDELIPILKKLVELQDNYKGEFDIAVMPLIYIYDYSLNFNIENDDLVIMFSSYDDTVGYTVRIPFSYLSLSNIESWFNMRIKELESEFKKKLEDPEYQEYLKLKEKYESN